jgi:hypothetical protein
MSILGKIRSLIASATMDAQELAFYRSVDSTKRDTWYKVLGPDGRVAGVEFKCICGSCYRFMCVVDFAKEHRCGACQHEFNLIRALGGDWLIKLSSLPAAAKVAAQTPQQTRYHDTWDNSGEAVKWAGGSMTGYQG